MGFLDSMVGELIRRETGFNAKPLLRKIGGRRLMMMGGAALAGGMLAQQANKQGSFGGSMLGGAGRGAVGGGPPSGAALPPTPGRVPSTMPEPTPPRSAPKNLPPLPPPPGGPNTAVAPPDVAAPADVPPMPIAEAERETDGDGPPAELLYVVVRTMIAAALADGELSDREKAAIESHLDDSGLTEQEQKQIRRDLVIAPAVGELAGMLPDGEDPELLLQFAILVLRADDALAEIELQWLSRLAVALGVDEGRAQALVEELASDLFESS